MTSISKPIDDMIALKDRAETFAESDLTTTLDNTTIVGQSVSLKDTQEGVSVSRNPDDATESTGSPRGLMINPNEDISGVVATVSSNTSGVSNAYLIEDSTGNTLAETSIIGGEVELIADMSAGTDYVVEANDFGSSYTAGKREDTGGVGYPFTSEKLDIVADDTGSTTASYNFISIAPIFDVSSGSAVVEWPEPVDIYRWDAATFTASKDGETVDVYIEESTDGGSNWTEIAGPIVRGQDITADPASKVRFRVDLSRANTSNNPTLDSIYRRWVV